MVKHLTTLFQELTTKEFAVAVVISSFVTLDGDKIKIATDEDDYILGIVSGEPFVLGNGDCDTWNGMFLHDGTAEVNGYVTVNNEGIATKCTRDTRNSYRVIKKVSDKVVEVIFR